MKIPEELKPYLHLLNNTGGNDPQNLLDRLEKEKYLSQTNIHIFVMACCVQSQLDLLSVLVKDGKLK